MSWFTKNTPSWEKPGNENWNTAAQVPPFVESASGTWNDHSKTWNSISTHWDSIANALNWFTKLVSNWYS